METLRFSWNPLPAAACGVALVLGAGIACTASDVALTPVSAPRTTLALTFQHVIDDQPLTLGTKYTTRFGEEVVFEQIRYWVTNVTLAQGNQVYEVPDSYYLVEQTEDRERLTIPIQGLPPGRYDKVVFHIGVDPAHNASLDLAAGELAAGIGMDWSWDTGYKFLRAEGTFVQGELSGPFSLHTGDNVLYKRLEAELPTPIDVVEDAEEAIQLQAQVDLLFTDLDLDTEAQIAGGPVDSPAGKVADNYGQMFWVLDPSGEAVHLTATSPNVTQGDGQP